MDTLRISTLRDRYVAYYDDEPASPDALNCLESALSIIVPVDMKAIARFFTGGYLGGISHYSFDSSDPALNIVVDKTKRFRTAVALPLRFVVLAEPAESSIVLDVESGVVTWCGNFDVCRLDGSTPMLGKPDTWPSYLDFFEHLLDQEDEERREQGM